METVPTESQVRDVDGSSGVPHSATSSATKRKKRPSTATQRQSTKRFKPPLTGNMLRSPVVTPVTGPPVMRLVVSPVVMGPRSPAHSPRNSPTSLAASPSASLLIDLRSPACSLLPKPQPEHESNLRLGLGLMELRSGRTLRSEPPLGARRRRPRTRPFRDTDGVDVDRISGLPDDLLHQILVRLRCARAAAHTSLLSHRWRHVWRDLPELSFRGIAPGALNAALAQFAGRSRRLLDIDVPERHRYSAAGVASLLRTLARLAPEVLSVVVRGDIDDHDIPVEVPVFNHATSMKLDVQNLYLVPPAQGGEFTVLEKLSISGCHVDSGFLVSQCPRLRVLELSHCWRLGIIMVHSATVEDLVVSHNGWIGGIDIVAPALKKFTMSTYMDTDFNISFSAPIVKDLSWNCLCDFRNVGFSEMWRLRMLYLWTEQSVWGLDLTIEMMEFAPEADRDLMEQITQLPSFSVLRLYLSTQGHVFGAMMLNLLGVCTTIQGLKLVINPFAMTDEACLQNCPCDQLQDWRNQNISLMALEKVAIENLEGTGHEVDFVKFVFRCAPLMKRMVVKLAPGVLPSSRGCTKIWDIFKANPSVKCYLYSSRGERVVYV